MPTVGKWRSRFVESRLVQALGRPQPAFPMMPGMPEKRTHDYVRNGTTSLFAAFNTEVMYPEVRALLPGLQDVVLESYEEHHVADVLVAELAAMTPDAERFDAKTTVLIRERHRSHGRTGAGLVPQGPRRPGPQTAAQPGRADDGAEEDRPDRPGATQRIEEGRRRGHHLTTIGPPARRSVTSRSPSTYLVPEHLSLCPP
jgi:hypothetical protein